MLTVNIRIFRGKIRIAVFRVIYLYEYGQIRTGWQPCNNITLEYTQME